MVVPLFGLTKNHIRRCFSATYSYHTIVHTDICTGALTNGWCSFVYACSWQVGVKCIAWNKHVKTFCSVQMTSNDGSLAFMKNVFYSYARHLLSTIWVSSDSTIFSNSAESWWQPHSFPVLFQEILGVFRQALEDEV
jgi:hypothetical protein